MNDITNDMAKQLLDKAKAKPEVKTEAEGFVQDAGFSDDPKGN